MRRQHDAQQLHPPHRAHPSGRSTERTRGQGETACVGLTQGPRVSERPWLAPQTPVPTGEDRRTVWTAFHREAWPAASWSDGGRRRGGREAVGSRGTEAPAPIPTAVCGALLWAVPGASCSSPKGQAPVLQDRRPLFLGGFFLSLISPLLFVTVACGPGPHTARLSPWICAEEMSGSWMQGKLPVFQLLLSFILSLETVQQFPHLVYYFTARIQKNRMKP